MSSEAPFSSRAGSRRIAAHFRSAWLVVATAGLLGMTACASSGSSAPETDPALNTPSSATEPLKEAPSDENTVKADPRVGLGAGLLDAEEAIWNLSLLSATPPPEVFVGVSNSDLAFKDKYAIQGNYNGFQVWDISNPKKPVLVKGYVCPASQSDVSVYRNLLFVSGEGMGGRLDCGTEGVQERISEDRLRGIRIFDISDIRNPRYIANVQTCRGSHTHTVLADPDDTDNVYIYVSGSAPVRPEEELPGCSGMSPDEDPNSALFRIEVIQVPLAYPEQAEIVKSTFNFAEFFPAFLQMMPGPGGSLWVQRVQEPTGMTAEEREVWNPLLDLGATEWDILDAEGRYLGVLDVPHRFQPVTFEGDLVYGIWRDEFDVQYVRVMRVVGLEATA